MILLIGLFLFAMAIYIFIDTRFIAILVLVVVLFMSITLVKSSLPANINNIFMDFIKGVMLIPVVFIVIAIIISLKDRKKNLAEEQEILDKFAKMIEEIKNSNNELKNTDTKRIIGILKSRGDIDAWHDRPDIEDIIKGLMRNPSKKYLDDYFCYYQFGRVPKKQKNMLN